MSALRVAAAQERSWRDGYAVAPARHVWRFLARRQRPLVEAVLVAGLYGAYQSTRGLMAGDATNAIAHARSLAVLERHLHVFGEAWVQHWCLRAPVLLRLLGYVYVSAHLAVTVAVLAWLYFRRPGLFPRVRTALIIASGIALLGYLFYPTAPPRMADLGIVDTLATSNHIEIQNGLVHSLYNPFAAVPSMHFAYAVTIALALAGSVRRRWLGASVAIVYPLLVLAAIVATGNHFFFDAAAGALVAAIAWLATTRVCAIAAEDGAAAALAAPYRPEQRFQGSWAKSEQSIESLIREGAR